jgi:CDP-paratose 2-epimerase
MKIIITGGAGFVGSSLCIRLKCKYPTYDIIAFDNLKRRGSELNILELKAHGVHFIHGDIRNPEDLVAVNGFDVMVEASAEPSVMAGLDSNPTYIINNNFNGSVHCFNECIRHNAKLVFLSTSRVYPIDRIENASYLENSSRFDFDTTQNEPGISPEGISEQLSIYGARSFYGTTKLASEFFIQEYSAFYGLKAAITRFGVIAGPRQMGKTDQGVATLWVAKHFWKQTLQYIGYGGQGKQVRDILHIEDALDLIDLQIHNIPLFDGKIYNAGGGKSNSCSLAEMSAICQTVTGNKITINQIFENRPADLRMYITDNTKIKNETGWTPKRSAEQVFTDIFNWIHRNENMLMPLLK